MISDGKLSVKMAMVRSKKVIPARADITINANDLEIVDLEKFLEITSPEHVADAREAIVSLGTSLDRPNSSQGRLTTLDVEEVVSTLRSFFETQKGKVN